MMPTSARCHPETPWLPRQAAPQRRVAGFSLIEILVVLVLVGLLAGVALPRFAQMVRQYDAASTRQNLIVELGNLPYRAYVTGQPLRLVSQEGSAPTDPATPPGPARAALNLPEGWRIQAEPAITYALNGLCSGGVVTLEGPDAYRERFVLAPPVCRPMPQMGTP